MKALKKPLPLLSKAESVVSITSQCSYSRTIVHVGDKKPQPESGECPHTFFGNVEKPDSEFCFH